MDEDSIMKRRDFLKLVFASVAASVLDLYLQEPEIWTFEVDDSLFSDAITIQGTNFAEGRAYADVSVDMEKIWSATTLTNDANGWVFYTADGEVWTDENGVMLDAYFA